MQEFMYTAVRRRPGIVVLHDLLMGLGFFGIHRTRKDLRTFRRSILAAEGEEVLAAFDRIMSDRKSGDAVPQLEKLFSAHYLLGWIVDASLAQIVHMECAKKEIEERYARARPFVVDMGVADPCLGRSRGDIAKIRWRHGLPSDSFVVGIFGTVVPVKRFDSCLEAVADLRRRGVDCLLLVVGDAPYPDYMARVRATVELLELGGAVRILGHVDRRTFDDLMLGADAVLNLRYPSLKGMSAILIRTMAAAKPAIISDIPEWSHLPEHACWRVVPDEREAVCIADRLERLARDAVAYEEASAEARDFFARRGTLRRMADQYLAVVEAVAKAETVSVSLAS